MQKGLVSSIFLSGEHTGEVVKFQNQDNAEARIYIDHREFCRYQNIMQRLHSILNSSIFGDAHINVLNKSEIENKVVRILVE
jgi:hypothetical protein